MIETRLLHYFLVTARERNITNAARVLHITQPTLSRQLMLLEDEVDAKLFVRGNRPLILTNEGVLLRRRAEEILSLLEKTEEELAGQDGQVEGTVSIGSGELASARVLAELAAEFGRGYPLVRFDIYTETADRIKLRMDEGLTDVGLLLEPVDMEHYAYIRMPVREQWVLIMPADDPLAQKSSVTREDLLKLPLILPSRQKISDEVAHWFGQDFERVRSIAAANLSTNACMLVQAGMGYELCVEGSMPFLDERILVKRPLYPELYSTTVLAWKRDQPLPAAAGKFIEFARQRIADPV